MCRFRKAVAAGGLCLLCAGGITDAGPASLTTVASVSRPLITARPRDHHEQPHTPEIEQVQLASPDREILERHVLTADHPRYGVLNGLNYLGYCETCPIASTGAQCHGPCAP